MEVILYADQFKRYRAMLQKGNVVVAHGEFSTDDYSGGVQMRAESVADIDTFRKQRLCQLRLDLLEEQLNGNAMKNIQQILASNRGGRVTVIIRYRRANGASGTLKLGADWMVHPTQPLFDALTNLIGSDNIKFQYEKLRLEKVKTPLKAKPRNGYGGYSAAPLNRLHPHRSVVKRGRRRWGRLARR